VLKQQTDYPWDGEVKLSIESSQPTEFDLHLRLPGWCQGASYFDDLYHTATGAPDNAPRLKLNGKRLEKPQVVRGYAMLHRRWKTGDVLQVSLDMPVKRVKANARVEADQGRVALMRGPIVYCFEGTDNGGAVQNLVLPPGLDFEPAYRNHLLGGVTVLKANGLAVFRTAAKDVATRPFALTAIPYYLNANRGTSPMQVWMPETQENCKPLNQE